MGKIIILPETTRNPITLIGERAGLCWGSDTSDPKKNLKRGLKCIESGHGRTLEFPNVEMVIDGYSARVMREWYTHIGCLPARLQQSTRYIDYSDFDYIVPQSVINAPTKDEPAFIGRGPERIYHDAMNYLKVAISELVYCGVPREDAALILPFGMTTRITDKRNLRNLIDMSHQRMCTRAYWEYREMFKDISDALSGISEEWEWIVRTQFKPKCELFGYCPEEHGCGKYLKKGKNGDA